MEKLYDRIVWNNNTTPELNETNLNAMSKAIDDIDDRVVGIAGDVLVVVPEILDKYADIEALTTNPPYIGQNGHWWTWDTDTNQYVDSGVDAGVSVTVGSTTTLPAGSDATVTNSGTDTDPILNFGIPQGVAGVGVPSGGTTGQVLKKASGTDYDTEWADTDGGGHTIINGTGTSMTQRAGLQFEGMGVSDDSTNDRTKVKLPIFTGNTAQWTALSSAEKAKYSVVNISDDYGNNEYHIGDKYYFYVTSYFAELANGYVDADNKYLYFIYYLDRKIGSDVASITVKTDLYSATIPSHGSPYITFQSSKVTAWKNGNTSIVMRIQYSQSAVSGGNLPTSGKACICGRPNECTYCYLEFN